MQRPGADNGAGPRPRAEVAPAGRRIGRRRWPVWELGVLLTTVALTVAAAPGVAVGDGRASAWAVDTAPAARDGPRGGGSEGAAAEPAGSPWLWPLEPRPLVVRGFEAPPHPYAAGHRGVDLAATPGEAVRAPAGGVVAFAGWVAGREVLSLDHADGLRTTYEPVRSAVTAGSVVRPGDVVGQLTAAPGHCLPGNCLHWGLRRGEDYLDPLRLVNAGRSVRLLPLRTGVAGPQLVRPSVVSAGWMSGPQAQTVPPRAIGMPARDRGPLLAGGR